VSVIRVKPTRSLYQTTAVIGVARPRTMLPASTRSPASAPRYVVIAVRAVRCAVQHEGECERRQQPFNRLDLRIAEAARRIRQPRRDDALTFAEAHALVDRRGECDIVGPALIRQAVEQRKFAAAIRRVKPSAQPRPAAFGKREERASRP